LAVPFLPIKQTTAVLDWPQRDTIGSVTAPLMAQVPIDLRVSIPCSLVTQLPAPGGLLLATAPPNGADAAQKAMAVRVNDTTVEVMDRDVRVAFANRGQMARCTAITVFSDNRHTVAKFLGLSAPGSSGELIGDQRPQVVGVFSNLVGAVPAGLRFHLTVDSRFSSSPSLLKQLDIVGAVLCTLIALFALARLDALDGRRHRRFLPGHWLKFTPVDATVFAVLIFWHFCGANTSDDGYILIMARTAPHAGYMANYFRWFGVPEAPFGWYYSIIEWMAKISTASPWVRLPALLAALLCWLVISREVAPRLGRSVRTNRVALWTGAMVFLAFWLPYNNGLRPEPIVALGALLTWCSVERAIGTGRLLPYAIAALIGAFTLAAAPTGLNCVMALVVGIRPLVRILVRKSKQVGALPLLTPIAAAGLLVLTVVYGGQTFAGIQEADRVRQYVGPNLRWYEDFLRYYWLFVKTVDGSLSRRFAFLVMLLCLFTMLLMLLRRHRIPGVANGPTWRLMGVVFGTIFLMMFNPTKWTHHFGAYAGIAGGLATVTAVTVSSTVLRSRRNQTIFLAGLLFVLALSFSGINGYWYVSSYGVPWFDKGVSVHGFQSNTLFLGLMTLAILLLAWQYLREGYRGEPSGDRRGRAAAVLGVLRRFGAAHMLALAAGLMVAFEVLSLLKGAVWQYPAYSLARSNIQALTGNSCGLANDVLVEPDTNQGRLRPFQEPGKPWQDPADPMLGVKGTAAIGFTPNGIPTQITADSVFVAPGQGNTTNDDIGPSFANGQSADTAGGRDKMVGVNGSSARLPFGLNPATTPVLGSYAENNRVPAFVITSWYALPARSADSPLIVVSAAGRIASVDHTGNSTYGQSVELQYGKRRPDGSVRIEGSYQPKDIGPAPSWRNLRVPFSGIAPDADAVRIIANDPILSSDQWLAFTPPRVPKLQSLNAFLGSRQPVLEDWAVGLQFPCQRPFAQRDGVAEPPNYRILPDRPLAVSSTDTWQAEENGGINGWAEMLAQGNEVPTYLKDNWDRDWGELQRYDPYFANVGQADIETGQATRWGWWTPGRMRVGKGL
jgi:arabinosyltransferase B